MDPNPLLTRSEYNVRSCGVASSGGSRPGKLGRKQGENPGSAGRSVT